MIKMFIDSDIIIDLLMNRKPFIHVSRHVIGMLEAGMAKGFTSAVVIANVFYLLRKYIGKKKALAALKTITSIIRVLPITHDNVREAFNNPGSDFEDSMQHRSAESGDCVYLVTRNIKDYIPNRICSPILPEEAIRIMSQELT